MSRVIAGLGEIARGYVMGDRMLRKDAEDAEDRATRKREEEYRIDEMERTKQNRISLANASRPTTVNQSAVTLDIGDGPKVYDDAGVANSDMRQARAMGLTDVKPPSQTFAVNGKSYTDRASADKAAADYNSPEQTDDRISLAMAQNGNPLGAKQYRAAARQEAMDGMKMADMDWGRQIRSAIQGGHEGLATLVTQSQGDGMKDHKIKPIPSADGKQVTYAKVNEDGTATPIPHLTFSNDEEGVVRAGYMLDRSVKPEQRYSHMIAEAKTKAAATVKAQELELKVRQLEEVAIPNAETKAALAEMRGQLAQAKAAGGSDKVGREERLRYTTLFSEAGRRMGEAQKALSSLRKDPMYSMAKAGSPQSQEMQGIIDSINSFAQERELYGSMLAGSQTGKPASLADVEPKSGGKVGQPVKVSTKAERDKLPKGARYIGPDGETHVKQ